MSEILATDTPITRTGIMDMDPDQLISYVETLQGRRLKSHTIYMEGQRLKQDKENDKQAAHLAKTLEKFEKQHEKTVKALDALHKCAIDIQAMRIALGDLG